MGKRRKAREVALQIVYAWDLNPGDEEVLLSEIVKRENLDPQTHQFMELLVRGTWAHLSEIDEKIKLLSKNWDFDRLTRIDRGIIRLAAYEMLYMPEKNQTIPYAVSINEAVDIAKKFSAPESGKFVNGILDQMRKIYLQS